MSKKCSSYYHVSTDTKMFTTEHLEIHKQTFNPNLYPEYFYGQAKMDISFHAMGLDYDRTVLVSKSVIDEIKQVGHQQKYRKGINKKFKSIKDSVNENGVDLRKKHLFLAENPDGTFTDIFSGNTVNDAITAGSQLENRIVSIFKQNENFTISNLIAIGVYLNTLEKPFGEATGNDLEFALNQIKDAGGFGKLDKNAGEKEQTTYAKKCKKYLAFMMGVKSSDLKPSTTDRLINKLMEQQLSTPSLHTVSNFNQVLDFLAEPKNGGYVSSPNMKYLSYGPYASKVPLKFSIEYNKDKNSGKKLGDDGYFDYENGTYGLIIHGGTPSPTDPIKWFFEKFTGPIIREVDLLYQFLTEDMFELPENISKLRIKPNFRILGFFQPVKFLEEYLPYQSIVSFEQVTEVRNKYYVRGSSTMKNVEESPSVIDSFIENDNDEEIIEVEIDTPLEELV